MAFKQKSGSPFLRNFGVGKSPAKQKSPAKNYKDMSKYSEEGDAVKFGDKDAPMDMGKHGKTATYMKSGFKMKEGSPFQRNFGIGDSPMKKLGIRPVLDDGSLGDHISASDAADIIADGGKVLKDGTDEVISNQAALVAEIKKDPDLREDIKTIKSGESIMHETDEGEEEQDIAGTAKALEAIQTTHYGEGPGMDFMQTDYEKWAEYMGPELAQADKEIQAYVNKHGSNEGMPAHLVAAQKELTKKANEMRKLNLQKTSSGEKKTKSYVEDPSVDEFEYGKIEGSPKTIEKELMETGHGTGGAENLGFEGPIGEVKTFQDIELGPDDVVQAGGTAQTAEEQRLADIAAAEKQASLVETYGEDVERGVKNAARDQYNQVMSDYRSENPPPNRKDYRRGKRGERDYRNDLRAHENAIERYEETQYKNIAKTLSEETGIDFSQY